MEAWMLITSFMQRINYLEIWTLKTFPLSIRKFISSSQDLISLIRLSDNTVNGVCTFTVHADSCETKNRNTYSLFLSTIQGKRLSGQTRIVS